MKLRIWHEKNNIFMTTSEYNEPFRKLARNHKFEWDMKKRCWSRPISSYPNIDDKIREMAWRVKNIDDYYFEISTDIDLNGYFEIENLKTIKYLSRKSGEYYFISWPYDEMNYWSAAIKITGARKIKGGIIVPIENWSETVDFSVMYDFVISSTVMETMTEKAGHVIVMPDLIERCPNEIPFLNPEKVRDEIHADLQDNN